MAPKQRISLYDMVAHGKENLVSDMDGEKVILSVTNGKYYNLGSVGGRIWDHIKKPMSVSQLAATLVVEYEIEQEECEKQVIFFLENLLEENLITIG